MTNAIAVIVLIAFVVIPCINMLLRVLNGEPAHRPSTYKREAWCAYCGWGHMTAAGNCHRCGSREFRS